MVSGRKFFVSSERNRVFLPLRDSAQTIIEVVNDHRVLVENHQGVALYEKEKVLVNVEYGRIAIYGYNLEMMHMTKEQLIIWGRIDSIEIQRRN